MWPLEKILYRYCEFKNPSLAQNSGDSCLERVFLISEKGQCLEVLNFFGVC